MPYSFPLRSLTKRQRQLIQDYADDVEGRISGKAEESSTQTESSNGEGSSSKNGSSTEEQTDGTASFIPLSSSSSSMEDGWISRVWRRIRGLTG